MICEECEIFQMQKEKALLENNSVYDAVIDVNLFLEKCRKNCRKVKDNGSKN